MPPDAERRGDLVRTESRPGVQGHRFPPDVALRFGSIGPIRQRSRGLSIDETDAIDRRQVVADVLPPLSLVLADEEIAGGAAERECSAVGIDVEPVAIDDVVGVLLRQALRAAPRSSRRRRACARRRARRRRGSATDPSCPARTTRFRGSSGCTTTGKPNTDGCAFVISVHVSPPSVLRKMPLWCWIQMWSGIRRALHDAMRVLAAALVRLIGRRVLGAHALAFAVPRLAAVRASARGRRTRRRSARRRGCADRRAPSGCRDSRRRRRPRTCGPGCFQSALDEPPAVAAVARVEQAARNRAAPELAVALRGFERPDLHDVPRDRRVAHRVDVDDVVGLRRVRRRRAALPTSRRRRASASS